MAENETRTPWGRVVLVAAITGAACALVTTWLQLALTGESSAAITGGVSGGVVGAVVPFFVNGKRD